MTTERIKAEHPLEGFVRALREHGLLALFMFFYFFLVITIFWVLKPIKKVVFIGFYDEDGIVLLGQHLSAAQVEQLAKVLNLGVAAVAVIVFTLLARRLRRQQLTMVFAGFFAVTLAIYAFTIHLEHPLVAWSFYLYGDLWTTLMVPTFFAFLNDSFRPEAAKRLYPVVVLGGVIGGAVGSTGGAVFSAIDAATWMWICIGATGAIVMAAVAAGRRVKHIDETRVAPARRPLRRATEQDRPKGSAALEGARLVFRSRYLLAIVTVVAVYEIVSTILDFQFTATVSHYLTAAEMDRHFPTVYMITNLTSLIVQMVLTTFVMNRFPLAVALLITPAIILMTSGAFIALPALWIGSMLSVSDNAFNYSINQSAREALYTPTTRDEKYKAKAFIDMFVQRFAKTIAVGVNLLLTLVLASFLGVRWLSVVTIALLAVWFVAARYAGKRFAQMTDEAAPAPGQTAAPAPAPAPHGPRHAPTGRPAPTG